MMNVGYSGNVQADENGYLRMARKCFSRVGLACAAFFIVAAASQLAVSLFLQLFWKQIGEQTWTFIAMLSMYPLAFPVSMLIMRTVPKGVPDRRYPMSPLRFLGIFVICIGAMFTGNCIGQALMAIVSLLTGRPIFNGVNETILGMDSWAVLLVAVILAPIVEETIFRKCFIDRLAPHGQLTAVLLSGGLFGLAHGNFYQFFYAFALGLIFAYVYLRTGRVRYTIALHMLVNFTGSIVPMALMKIVEEHVLLGSFLAAGEMMLLCGSVVCAVILLVVCRRDIWFSKSRRRIPAGRWLSVIFGNVGMILFLMYCLFSFIWM